MREKLIKKLPLLRSLKDPNFSDLWEKYISYLTLRGYCSSALFSYLRVLDHFVRWLNSKNFNNNIQINKECTDEFINNHLSVCKCLPPAPKYLITVKTALNHLLAMLNIVSCVSTTNDDINTTLKNFDDYLNNICGLAESTRFYRCRYAREFLVTVFESKKLDFSQLTPVVINNYIDNVIKQYKKGSIGVLIYSLSSFFKFLQFIGEGNSSLISSLPKVPNWKSSSIPDYLKKSEINKILSSCNRTTAVGKRDYAIIRCLVDLGLRCSEVASLQLDNIQWRSNTLVLPRSKTRQADVLPLTPLLSEALIDYLKNGRLVTTTRSIFVFHHAPLGAEITPETIRGVIRRAYARAGFSSQLTGTHILRRSMATHLLQGGASIKEIADVLRHRCIDTTTLYTKIELSHLSQVVLPWPRRIP